MVKLSLRLFAFALAAAFSTTVVAEETISLFSSHDETPLFAVAQETTEALAAEQGSSISTPEAGPAFEAPAEQESFSSSMVGVSSLFGIEKCGHIIGGAELLFLRYNSDLGNRRSAFDFEAAPRFTLGYVNAQKLGFRTIYFEFDEFANDAGGTGRTGLSAYNVDFELFKQIQLTKTSNLEFSGGLRYNEADYFLNGPTNLNNFHGIGIALGTKASAKVFTGGNVYGRAKFAILSGEAVHDTNAFAFRDSQLASREQMELGLGYEHPVMLGRFEVTPSVGAELQRWGGYAIDPVDEHPEADLGLAGFVLGLGIAY
ncbi:MAG: hypothetical protein JNM43_09370 [Planctomycetaceae bacterium]|nr:hypothetical protein [Planctomycetaceae bacterium]